MYLLSPEMFTHTEDKNTFVTRTNSEFSSWPVHLLRALLVKEGEGKERLDLKPVKRGVTKELISWSGMINK